MTHPIRRGIHLVRRNRVPRAVGVILSACCIAAALAEQPFNPWHWVIAPYFTVIWPQLAWWWASRSAAPLRAEYFNLWADSAHAGFWMAAMGFSLVPSLALLTATSLSNITVGSLKLVFAGFSAHVVGAALGVAVWGWHPHWQSGLLSQVGAATLFFGYPLMLGQVLYRLAMRLKTSQRELRHLSMHDPLSGVYNRRHLDETLQQAFSRFLRTQASMTLMICDVDEFKQINDRFGHAAGDEVIRQLGSALRQCARGHDTVGRLGGDEFVILLDGAWPDHAVGFGARVQTQLQTSLADAYPDLTVRLSFGIAGIDNTFSNAEQWLARADTELYARKAERHLLR